MVKVIGSGSGKVGRGLLIRPKPFPHSLQKPMGFFIKFILITCLISFLFPLIAHADPFNHPSKPGSPINWWLDHKTRTDYNKYYYNKKKQEELKKEEILKRMKKEEKKKKVSGMKS